ncbi:MAG: hypothetical protein KDJ22_15895 [Candidatus Competibacteraceae bacterium]|nr:hypothetical protein [Candidatus Competibacteraceae bacterium]MCB1920466.1 hypothetical protein [Candidatus Competibacteraceae bacterium]MCP5126148.1 hypothetical protein [Gammaproteobacteria bacterium]HRX71202.1 hypothetical protein [Candidatus Competibacteraceae bacterium]
MNRAPGLGAPGVGPESFHRNGNTVTLNWFGYIPPNLVALTHLRRLATAGFF